MTESPNWRKRADDAKRERLRRKMTVSTTAGSSNDRDDARRAGFRQAALRQPRRNVPNV